MMKGAAISYSAKELDWIKAHKTDVRREAHAKFCKKFKREDVSFNNYKALCTRKGWHTGRTGKFEDGAKSWNKGKKMPFNPNSARTQFKKGNKPHNTNYLGHERVSKDGYVEISIDEPNPHTGFARRYVLKHRWLWEQANGPLPEGMCLKCLDGDKTNTDLSNWEMMPRGLLPRLNSVHGRGYDQAPAELKPVIMTTAKLAHKASELSKSNEDGDKEIEVPFQ